jgi:hypothetical protein
MEERSRCKVYTLQPDGSWKDSGTGFASVEVADGPWEIRVRNEAAAVIWSLRLSPGDRLQRQQGAQSSDVERKNCVIWVPCRHVQAR